MSELQGYLVGDVLQEVDEGYYSQWYKACDTENEISTLKASNEELKNQRSELVSKLIEYIIADVARVEVAEGWVDGGGWVARVVMQDDQWKWR